MIKVKFNTDKTKLVVNCIKAAIFLALYVFFWFNADFYSQISKATGEPMTDLLLKRIAFVTILCVGGIVISLWEITLSDKWNKLVLIGMALFTPVVSFLALEYANIRKSRLVIKILEDMGIKKVALTLVILMLVMIGIYIISNRVKLSAIILSVAIIFFGLLCYYVYEFRGIPFLASDLSTAGAAMSVMGNYEYTLDYQPFILLLVMIFWCALLLCTKEIKGVNWKKRVGALVVYTIIGCVLVHTLVFTDFLNDKMKVTLSTFRPEKSYGFSGSILAVIRSTRVILVEKPEGYSVEAAMKIAEQYPEVEGIDEEKPNIIIVMNEAFTDFQTINNFKTNKEVLPYLNKVKEQENVVSGDMYVSVFGGNTATTEFEVLTGCSQAFAPPASTAYQLFIKDVFPSLTHTLKEKGYQGNKALHPYHPQGYNRKTVYPYLGFEEFLAKDAFEDAELIRKYVSDEALYNRLIAEYEEGKKASDAPFYALTVTMQNHSGYAEDFDNLQKDIKILDEEFQYDKLERYLNLINVSDKALEKLIGYFEEQEEPTMVVFFGDHQPRQPNEFYNKLLGGSDNDLTNEELMEKYKVPFIIWANYDIEEQKNVKTSANYLGPLILESAKMQSTRWNTFLADTAKEIPIVSTVGYYGSNGKFYDLDEETSPYYEQLKNYQILQYNYMFDKGNRVENFFDK